MRFINAKFIKSASKKAEFIEDELPQIAIVGRSNVGKSSLLNALLEEEKAIFPRILVKTKVSKDNQKYYLMEDKKDNELFLNIFHLCKWCDYNSFKYRSFIKNYQCNICTTR